MPRRARSLNFPPRSTATTVPRARLPAGIATWPPTRTSRTTWASTRSSTFDRSLLSDVSVCRPMTESAATTSSEKVFAGGSGARGVSCAWSSGRGAGCAWLSVDDGAGAGVDWAPLGQDRSRTGGCDCRDADAICLGAVDLGCAAGSLRLDVDGDGAEAAEVAAEGRLASGAGVVEAVTSASVSCTGRAVGSTEAAEAWDAAMSVTLCRVARYPPAPAAPIQAVASAAKARRFGTMNNLSPSGTVDIVTQGAYPGPNPSCLCKRPKNRRLEASLGLGECHLPEKCPHFVATIRLLRAFAPPIGATSAETLGVRW